MNALLNAIKDKKRLILKNEGRLLKKSFFGLLILTLAFQSGEFGVIVRQSMVDAYLAVSVFVGFTLIVFIGLDSLTNFNVNLFLEKVKKFHVPIASLLGAIPGCGGAIIVVTQYIQGRISFGSLVAVLTATMGDAAFLILALEPSTGALIFGIGIFVGTISGYIVDTTIFNPDIKPIERKKEKFTFLSPARMGLQKGTEKIWEALKLCKSDFEMIQIKWYDNRNSEEEEIAQKWINNPPKQVKFVPIMPREELGRYMVFADAILGQVSGIQADVDRSGALCKKAVVHYADPKRMYIVNDKIIPSPFLPHSNDPKIIAETIDKVVTDETFRKKLAEEEYEFVMNLSEPNMIAKQWDELFEKMHREYNGAVKGTSKIKMRLRVIGYLIANRLHKKKFKRVFTN